MSDSALYAKIAEVHYWPHLGRIIVVNKEPHYTVPMVTGLDVTPGDLGLIELSPTTELIALALAEAGRPTPMDMVCHDANGSMESVNPVSLARTMIKAGAAK